jgi:hypothetical protein
MKCEVIGWVLEDPERSEILVREANGQLRTQKANPESASGEFSIQTGAFRRGKRIVDAATLETLGYEMQRLSSAYALD